MFLSDFSIKRPIAAIVIIITLMGLGAIALTKLRVNQNPDVALPLIVVDITYPGASPDTVEREIVNRIERTFQGIEGVDQARSQATAREGEAEFVLFFDFHKDLSQASDEIRNAIGTVRYQLPIEMREPVLTRIDPSARPDHVARAVVRHAEPRADLAAGRRQAGRPLPRHPRRLERSTSPARSSASSRCCCTRRSCASSACR